jgi:4-hydroxybenzoate polyprenyltransferase
LYIFNDLLDRKHDRIHLRKRSRPFAADSLSPKLGLLLAAGCLAGALILSLAWPGFVFFLGAYLVLGLVYSAFLKRFIMIDVVTLTALYCLRVVAGGAVAYVPLSEWLVSFCIFFFLTLAIVKRLAEIRNHPRQPAGRGYLPADAGSLQALASSAAMVSVMVWVLYIAGDNMPRHAYDNGELLWGLVCVLTFWLGRVIILTNRGEMHDDPVVFAITDKVSLASIGASGLFFFLAI